MKKLYRLEISGWWPVVLDENTDTTSQRQLKALYEHCEVNPYDFDDLTLRIVPATAADIAKYGEDDDGDDT
jgi:hypothetical protein